MPKKKPILMVVFALTLLFSAILPSASTQQPRPFAGIPEIRRLTPVEVLEEKPAAILDYTLHTTAGKFKPAITDVEAIVAPDDATSSTVTGSLRSTPCTLPLTATPAAASPPSPRDSSSPA